MNDNDHELLLKCRQGDPQAFADLMQQYERLVFSIPFNYGFSRAEADDITQNTFVIFIENMERLQDDSNLGAWLATIARRQTWRHFRKKQRETSIDTHDEESASMFVVETDFNNLDRQNEVTMLHEALAQINEKCRQLLQALYFDMEQPSYEEIAQTMGMPLGSVGPTRARCLKKLKKIMPFSE